MFCKKFNICIFLQIINKLNTNNSNSLVIYINHLSIKNIMCKFTNVFKIILFKLISKIVIRIFTNLIQKKKFFKNLKFLKKNKVKKKKFNLFIKKKNVLNLKKILENEKK